MKKRVFTALLICLALLLAGCQGSGQNQGGIGPDSQDKKLFEPIAGEWYSDSGTFVINIYENGGFYIKQVTADIYGYLIYTEETNEEGVSGPHYDLYEENNEKMPGCCLIQDANYPGTLTFEQGMGAELLTKDYVEPPVIDWVYVTEETDSSLASYEKYDSLEYVGSEYTVNVMFHPLRDVENFKFYHTYIKDVDGSGRASFAVDLISVKEKIEAEVPYLIPMEFPGDTPNNAISYTDPWTFKDRFFLVEQSGYDGHVLLVELQTE